jgi:DNA-binding transcriptional ArsR family regulator
MEVRVDVEPSIASIGAMLAVPARANILIALFDGRALTATELALAGGVTPQTTSSHLSKLVDAGLLRAEVHGRHHYYRLAGPEIASALEPLTLIVANRPVPARGRSRELEELRTARMCYDHLAGKLGVEIARAMQERRLIRSSSGNFELTGKGEKFCQSLDIDIASLQEQRRMFARECLDWSERKLHIGGALGAALSANFIERQWIVRARARRRVFVSETGGKAFRKLLGLDTTSWT